MPNPQAGYQGVALVGTAPTPTNDVGQKQDVEIPLSRDMYDTTSMGASAWKTFIPGLIGGMLNMKFNYDMTDTLGQVVIQSAFVNGTLLYWIVKPLGTTTPSSTFTAYVKDYKIHDPVNNKVDLDVALQITGAVVFA